MRIENMNIANPLRGHDLRGRKSAKAEGAAPSFEEQITRHSADDTASASTSSTSTAAADLPDASVTMSGEEYLKLQQESAAANSPEAKSAAEHKALREAAQSVGVDSAAATETKTTAPVGEAAAENDKTYYVEGGPTLIEQFGEKFLDVLATPNTCTMLKMKENSVCSTVYGIGGTQYVYAEYTADSTPEDPIVRIFCQSNSGLYEFTRHINDIDPSNCTFAELDALHGHLQKNGVDIPGYDDSWPVTSGYEIGDLMRRQNFLMGLNDLSQSKMFDPGILADAEALFEFYSMLAEERKAMEAEDAEFEALMNAVDNVIKSKAPIEPKEMMERLSEPAKDTLENIKADKEVSQEEWLGLLGELRDMGAISNTEFGYTRGDLRVVPLGYRDGNGGLVRYGNAGRFAEARLLQLAGLETSEDAVVDWSWNNDPLAFLDDWIAELTEWRDDLSRERSASGAPKYDDFSPIDDQVAACTKVSELVKGLVAQTE